MTSLAVNAKARAFALNEADVHAVQKVADTLLPVAGGRIDDPTWIARAGLLWHELPASLRKALAEYRRYSGPAGTFLVHGLPVGEALLPATPTVSGSVQRQATVSSAVLVLVANALGDPIAFRQEKSGAIVQDVVPVPGNENFQGNEGSVLLTFHNENTFHPHRPDYVLLLCLRADHERTAGLRTASIREVLPALSDAHRDALFRRKFLTLPPPSFASPGVKSKPHAVLTGAPDDPDVSVDFTTTKPLTEAAGHAMTALQSLFTEHATTHYLTPGDLAIVDNRIAVHGRSAFTPRYDGMDRWLQRTYVVQDLRRSRGHRTADSHVLVK